MKQLLTLVCLYVLFSSTLSGQSLTDIDGNTYKTIKIGDQVWMAENLKVSKFRDGSPITFAANEDEWNEGYKIVAYVYPNFDPELKEEGFVYSHEVVFGEKEIAPEGWRVPTQEDWYKLNRHLQDKYDSDNISAACENLPDYSKDDCLIAQQLRSENLWQDEDGDWREKGANGSGFNAKQLIVYHNQWSSGEKGFDGWSKYAGETGWYSSTVEVVEHPGSEVMPAGTYEYKKGVLLGVENRLNFDLDIGYYTGLFIRLIKDQ